MLKFSRWHIKILIKRSLRNRHLQLRATRLLAPQAQCLGRALGDNANGCGSVGDQVSISFGFYERHDLLFQGNSIARSSETIGRTRRSGTELGVKSSNPQTNDLTEIRNEIKKNLEKMKEENTRVCSSPLGSVSNLDAAFNRCRSQLLFPCL